MNLPNKLTMLRIILVPFFVLFMSIESSAVNLFIALIIFSVASLTDMLDGKIARKYGLVTNFGKLMDPLADKLLVCSALICFVSNGQIPAWIVIVIVAREFIISGFRLIAVDAYCHIGRHLHQMFNNRHILPCKIRKTVYVEGMILGKGTLL